MKAAIYDVEGAPGVLKYVDVPDPVAGPDEILISVEAISIEGGDLINRRSTPPPLPSWIVGYAAAGTVVVVGSKVRNRRVGDRVTAFSMQGSHAERWAVPEERTWLIPTGWIWQKRRRYRFLLQPRIIAFSHVACSGTEKLF